MVNQTLSRARIPQMSIYDYLQKVFIASLHAISNEDYEFLYEYMEKGFVDNIASVCENLKQNNLYLRVSKDIEDEGDMIVSSYCDLIDGMIIKGVTSNRETNGNELDYHHWMDLEDMGVAILTHKKYSNPENFIDPEENKRIYDDFDTVLLRILVNIKTPMTLNIMNEVSEQSSMDEFLGKNSNSDYTDKESTDYYNDKMSCRKFFK